MTVALSTIPHSVKGRKGKENIKCEHTQTKKNHWSRINQEISKSNCPTLPSISPHSQSQIQSVTQVFVQYTYLLVY